MEVNMWPAAASVAVLGLVACVGLISRRRGNTVDNGVADDRWFTITQWMANDEAWKNEVEEAIDNLDALHTWTEKVAGQLEKIGSQVERIDKFCNLDAYAKTFVTIPSSGRAVQGKDGLVWMNVQPKESGYYWFLGETVWEGNGYINNDMSLFVVQKDSDVIRASVSSYNMSRTDAKRFRQEVPTFKGWWAKMEVPEFKEPK
jgi:hypothetical protein